MPQRSYTREQDWLLPPSLSELVPADHPVRFVAELVDRLDLGEAGIQTAAAREGAPSYHPKALLATWLYGFMTQVRSSRKLECACRENIMFMWLTGMQRPDHVTLWRFYQQNRPAMRPLLRQTVRLACEVGLVDFALQAIDGCRVVAAAKASWRGRAALEQLLAQVETEIAAMEQAHREPAEAASGRPGKQALRGRQQRRARLQRALAAVMAAGRAPKRARQQAGDPAAGPPSSAHASTTDPEAVWLKGRHDYGVGYNGQAVVDSKAQIIVAADVVAGAADHDQLAPMLDEAQAMTGRSAQVVVADTGYFSMIGIAHAMAQKSEVYVPDRRATRKDAPATNPYHKEHFRYDAARDTYRCPLGSSLHFYGRQQRGARTQRVYEAHSCLGCPAQHSGACTTGRARRITIWGHEALLQAHAARMQTAAARTRQQQRSATVEPVFAAFREQLGLARFLVRGLANVKAEWRLLAIAHNLRKLWKLWWRPQRLAQAAVT